jgi:phosphonate transport system substrate-binding protein
MMRKFLALAAAAWLSIAAVPVTQAETLKLAITDLVGLEELQREFGPFKAELEKHTGYQIDFLPVTNRTAALEALRFKKVDFVLAGPAEYVVMRKRAKADVVVGLYRPDYFSMIVVKADSPYFSLKNLKGKHMGMGSVGSTSRHLGPMHVLSEAGLNPLKDIKVTHTNVKVAWEALKKGDVDAVGFGRSDYESLLAKEAEKGGLQRNAFRILARSPDLPNDLLMVGAHVPKKTVDMMRAAISQNSDTLIEAILKGADHVKRYKGMRFLPQISDNDYDVVRTMYGTAGYPEYADFIGD